MISLHRPLNEGPRARRRVTSHMRGGSGSKSVLEPARRFLRINCNIFKTTKTQATKMATAMAAGTASELSPEAPELGARAARSESVVGFTLTSASVLVIATSAMPSVERRDESRTSEVSLGRGTF